MSKVLVVDDKEMMRDSVATILGRRGHSVIAAASGKAALERIGNKRPDAVVTDLQMPGMSGLELLAEIRRIDEDLPVVFMTAYGSIDTAVEAMRSGADEFYAFPGHTSAAALGTSHDELRRAEHLRPATSGRVLRLPGAFYHHDASPRKTMRSGAMRWASFTPSRGGGG